MSNNGKINNFVEGSFKQLYVADPSEHKFLLSLANSPSTFSSIINSVLSLLPGFSSKQTNSNKHTDENQVQSAIEACNTEAFHNNNGNKDLNISTDTIANVDISDLVDTRCNLCCAWMCTGGNTSWKSHMLCGTTS